MKAILFANRSGAALAPLSDRTCVALLPVAGKPLLVHAIDDLAMAGVREVTVVASPHAEAVEHALGSGARWGMQFDHVVSLAEETAEMVTARLRSRFGGDFLVVRGDVLRSPCIGAFVERAATVAGPTVAATVGDVPAGLWLVRAAATTPLGLLDDPEAPQQWRPAGPGVALDGAALSLLESLAAYHRANIDAAAGRFPGLILAARSLMPGVFVGRQSRVPRETIKGQPVFVGSRCDVKRDAELMGDVVLSDDVVVDRRATLRAAVVLPHTYVGELVDVTNAIVWTNDLIHVDTGAVTRVTDAFLLADLRGLSLGVATGDALHRVLGTVLFLVTLPLWPLAALASLAADRATPFRRVHLLGNRTVPGDDGRPRRREFSALEGATSVPLLRHLPKLLAVVRGDLRLVGVTPLTPAVDRGRTEEWERVRDEAPVGLVGPAQLDLPADAPDEERWVAEAYYARTRTTRGDLRLLLRACAAAVIPRAWRTLPSIPEA